MSDLDIEKSLNSNFHYAQWEEWNFDNWIKGTT
jgi:hypothetical protein